MDWLIRALIFIWALKWLPVTLLVVLITGDFLYEAIMELWFN